MEPGTSRPFGGDLIITERRWRGAVRDVERRVGRAMEMAACHADVVLTDDRTVKRLNAMSRNKNKPTNVLTYEQPPEIILAFGTVRREAEAAGRSVAAHLAHLLIHGALHLAGHDHHHAGEARRMEAAEAVLLSRLKIANPWKNR
jgi:probable rRNA maturation factor